MILSLILAAQAAAATPPTSRPSDYADCAELAASDPIRAVDIASRWRLAGGGTLARQCLGLAYAAQERWAPAAVAFEQAAREAETERNPAAATLWVQAGNARLAGGEAQEARAAFNAALASNILEGEALGEAHLDRARAAVALDDLATARTDLDRAVALVPADPLAWLLSATLARRQNDLERAAADIAEAAKRSPDDAAVALEAGNIAMLSGAPDAARVAWQGAVQNQPDSPAGKAAAEALAALDAPR